MMPDTKPLTIPANFDAAWYLRRYPDVADADVDPAAHFLSNGQFEGRFPNAQAEADHSLSAAVDAEWYLQRYPDVADADADPAAHFLSNGRFEGRFPNAQAEADHSLSAAVDAEWYLARYPDVAESGIDPIDHYILYGRAEGRTPSPEAESPSVGPSIPPIEDQIGDASPATAVQLAYEIILARGAAPHELQHYSHMIEANQATVRDIVESLFVYKSQMILSPPAEAQQSNDPSRAYLYGKNQFIDLGIWTERRIASPPPNSRSSEQTTIDRFPYIKSSCKPRVSIITSLYKGGDFIEYFMENITQQSIFDDCELIIIDAASPEQEEETIKRYQENFKNIIYKRINYRIGIYEAWNLGVQLASGLYCTNANLDDCRAVDSLEVQASALDTLPFVDVVYQDVYYSFDSALSFDQIKSLGFKTDLPIVSRYNLLEFNLPHNGPMWRRSLHDDVGMFNNDYKSAADFEFWMRCAIAEKCFYKINRPTVAYYVNPKGLSTSADTRGVVEANDTTRRLNRRLISPFLTMRKADLKTKLEELSGSDIPTTDRYAMVQQALRAVSINSRRKG